MNVKSFPAGGEGGGGSNPIFTHFCPSPNPDFDVFWGKMGKNVQKWGKKCMEREGKSIHFSKLLILYYHYFRHIDYNTRFFV